MSDVTVSRRGEGEARTMSATDLTAAFDALVTRISTLHELAGDAFPIHATEDGWFLSKNGGWNAGHWVASLVLAASATGDEGARNALLSAAQRHTEVGLDQRMDNLFAGMNHYYAGFYADALFPSDERVRIGVRGADAMAANYHERAHQVPMGPITMQEERSPANPDQFPPLDRWDHIAAVDTVHTSIPCLLAASRQTGVSKYRDIAIAHSLRHVEWHMRPDGSTVQLTEFDDDGTPGRRWNVLAKDADGCWARGLAWSLAGLSSVYSDTQDDVLLEAMSRSVEYMTPRTRHGIPIWDLEDERSDAPIDSSAAAIASYGLIGLVGDSPEAESLRVVGRRLLAALIDHCQVRDVDSPDFGAIKHSTYQYPFGVGIDTEMMVTDFYTAAALHRLLRGGERDRASSHARKDYKEVVRDE